MSGLNNGFGENIGKKEERRIKARLQKGAGLLAWFGMFGIIGWSVSVPLLLGIFLGKWLDSFVKGRYSFTLMLMFAGLVFGCVNAWFWVKRVGMKSGKEVQSPEVQSPEGRRNPIPDTRNPETKKEDKK